jgi:hypothetical protein
MEPNTQIIDLAPEGWFKDKAKSSIFFTAYRILLGDKGHLKGGQIYDFEKLRILIFFGKLNYLAASSIRPQIDNNGNIELHGKIEHGATSEAGWLLIIQPFIIDGVEQNEYQIRTRAGLYAAFYAALNGRNMAFEREFDNIASLLDGHLSAASPSFINPLAFPKPELSKKRLVAIYNAGKQIETKYPKDRQRIELSLHWFEKGLRSTSLDGFINYWVALETLGMPDTTNIKPLNESLAKAYGISVQDASQKFGIGKIFGLRSRILHNGENLPIHQLLSAYMESLFADILLDHLGIQSERKSISVLDQPGFDLDKLVHVST